MDLHVYVLGEGTAGRQVLSLLAPEHLGGRAPPGESIIGSFTGDAAQLAPGAFAVNRTFLAFLHWVVARHGPASPELREQAQRPGTRAVAVVDQRTTGVPPRIPARDVVGAFDVVGGRCEAWRMCADYEVLTADGFPQLGAYIEGCLVEELRRLVEHAGSAGGPTGA